MARGTFGTSGGMETIRTTFNSSITTNWASFADLLVDVRSKLDEEIQQRTVARLS